MLHQESKHFPEYDLNALLGQDVGEDFVHLGDVLEHILHVGVHCHSLATVYSLGKIYFLSWFDQILSNAIFQFNLEKLPFG